MRVRPSFAARWPALNLDERGYDGRAGDWREAPRPAASSPRLGDEGRRGGQAVATLHADLEAEPEALVERGGALPPPESLAAALDLRGPHRLGVPADDPDEVVLGADVVPLLVDDVLPGVDADVVPRQAVHVVDAAGAEPAVAVEPHLVLEQRVEVAQLLAGRDDVRHDVAGLLPRRALKVQPEVDAERRRRVVDERRLPVRLAGARGVDAAERAGGPGDVPEPVDLRGRRGRRVR